MLLWALTICAGMTLALTGLTLGLLWRQRHDAEGAAQAQAVSWHAELATLATQVESGLTLLTAHQARAQEQIEAMAQDVAILRVSLQAKQKAEEGLFIGAFLPDDAQAADLERQIKQSEDRALDARGPIRYSSRLSPTSGNPSRRVPSTQRPRTSGER